MYETNPRFQSQTVRHASLGSPQQPNVGLQQQPSPLTETSPTQPSQPGMSAQRTPPVGELAAQLAELQARQSSLEAQQAQTQPQHQPTTPSPTAQQVSPTMQPSAGGQPSPQAPPQQPQQPQGPQPPQQHQGPQPPQQHPIQQPSVQPSPTQQPSMQQGSPQAYQEQLRSLPNRLRSMMGVPIFGSPGQGSQQPSQGGQPQGPTQHPVMQPASQMSPQFQQQGPQGSPFQPQTGSPFGQQASQQQAGQRTIRQPPVDILDEGEDLVLEIELPGARKEDIQLTGRHNAIQLDVPTRERGEKENVLQSERGQIHYQRLIPLGIEIDSEKIKAKFEDGVLRVKAPKRDPTSAPQRIDIN